MGSSFHNLALVELEIQRVLWDYSLALGHSGPFWANGNVYVQPRCTCELRSVNRPPVEPVQQ